MFLDALNFWQIMRPAERARNLSVTPSRTYIVLHYAVLVFDRPPPPHTHTQTLVGSPSELYEINEAKFR